MKIKITTTQEDHLIAGLTALAIAIYVLESAIPSPMPGVKPGLANIIVILVLLQYGGRMAVWVSLLRVLVGSLIIGTFLTPAFFLSFSGAIGSLSILLLARPLGFGPVGLCLLAALSHISCQFGMAYLLFIPNPALFNLLPILLTMAAFFGIISGIITVKLLNYMKRVTPQKIESTI